MCFVIVGDLRLSADSIIWLFESVDLLDNVNNRRSTLPTYPYCCAMRDAIAFRERWPVGEWRLIDCGIMSVDASFINGLSRRMDAILKMSPTVVDETSIYQFRRASCSGEILLWLRPPGLAIYDHGSPTWITVFRRRPWRHTSTNQSTLWGGY